MLNSIRSSRLLSMVAVAGLFLSAGRAYGQVTAFVIPLGDGAARIEADDVIIPDPLESFSTVAGRGVASVLNEGQTLTTTSAGGAIVTFPDLDVSVRLSRASRLDAVALPELETNQALVLGLATGAGRVTGRSTDGPWLVFKGGESGRAGQIVSRGASVSIVADPQRTVFSVASGTAYFFAGDLPGDVVSMDGGALAAAADHVIQAGQQWSSAAPDQVTQGQPDEARQLTAADGFDGDVYALGVRSGAAWVKDAEEGDFTPVRQAASAPSSILPPGGLGPQYAFDQARAAVVARAPQSQRDPVRTQGVSPVRALLTSGRPTEVIIGSRLARTRIIRGRSGGIGVNPSVDPLFTLAGR